MLPRKHRLVAAAEHRLVARKGRRRRRGALLVTSLGDRGAAALARPARLSVVVPKAVGSAPVRNRLRRRLQHVAAPWMDGLPVGSLIVVRAHPGAARLTSASLGDSLDAVLRELRAPTATGPT